MINMCRVKAFRWHLEKQPQSYVVFLRKMDKFILRKINCEQVPLDVHKIKREGFVGGELGGLLKLCRSLPFISTKGNTSKEIGLQIQDWYWTRDDPVHQQIYDLILLELLQAKKTKWLHVQAWLHLHIWAAMGCPSAIRTKDKWVPSVLYWVPLVQQEDHQVSTRQSNIGVETVNRSRPHQNGN